MAISNELSSEIATALLLAKDRSDQEINDLKNILLEVHTTLQDMTKRYQLERQVNARGESHLEPGLNSLLITP
jgi:hypothetical protein